MAASARSEAHALCAEIALRADLASFGEYAAGDPVDRLIAWVRGWAAVHDPDADVAPSVPGLPLAPDVTALLHASSVFRAIAPTRERYDEVVVLGASSTGIWRRLDHVDAAGVRAHRLTLLAGRRPHLGRSGDGRDGDIDALLGPGGPFPAAAGWHAPELLVAQDRVGVEVDADPWVRAARVAPDETSIALLLLDRRWPSVRDGGSSETTRLGDGRVVVGRVLGEDGFLRRDGVAGRFDEVGVLDAMPVSRRIGPARPTTRSTLTAWLERADMATSPSEPRVLVVTGQPHVARVARLAAELRVTERLGSDVEVVGPAPLARVAGAVLLRELVEIVASVRAAPALR